jgi:hypothetical protein
MLLSYHAGDRFLSVRSLFTPATAVLNVIINRKVYVIELATDKEPFQSVTFYPADEPPAQSAGQPNVGPSRLLGLLDKAKAYPLLAEQYPEMVSQIDKAEHSPKRSTKDSTSFLRRSFGSMPRMP